VLQIWITWYYGECYLRITSYTAAQPGSGVDHPSASCTEVKERVKLYVYSSLPGTSWLVIGWTLPFAAAQSSNWPAVQKVNRQGFWRCVAKGRWGYCWQMAVPWCSDIRIIYANMNLLLKKIPALYGTRKFITAFKTAYHLSISWAR
jgi:hypothetical protein